MVDVKTTNPLTPVFSIWPSMVELAADIDESHWTVNKWWQRKRIPQDYWGKIVVAAKRKGKHLSADDLLAAHTPVKTPARKTAVACK
jgi:hypothetical protein